MSVTYLKMQTQQIANRLSLETFSFAITLEPFIIILYYTQNMVQMAQS